MPETIHRKLPYPAASSAPDVPVDLQKLAEKLDAELTELRARTGALVPVRPTSVTGTGASIDADGTVRLVGGSGVLMNGVFTEQFDEYLVKVQAHASSQATAVYARYGSGGASDGANHYFYVGSHNTSSRVGEVLAWAARPATQFDLARVGQRPEDSAVLELRVSAPMDAARRTRSVWSAQGSDGLNDVWVSAGGSSIPTAKHDGLHLFVNTGTAVLSAKVYGYGRAL